MPRIPKGSKGTLGKSIMKSLNKKKYVPSEQAMQEAKFIHLENNNEILKQQQKQNLASVIDQDNLDEFLVTAEQAEKKYDAERGIRVAKDEQGHEIIYSVNKQDQEMQDFDVQKNKLLQNLRIPRKPKWNTEMTKKELISAENEAFLMWRRGLAQIEKDYYTVHITPYEKNIEVWKQLWRVVERSDILVQIVDGRDPLFYRCEDLESYVKESGSFKQNFLVINKSDLLSEEVRKAWNKYFIENGVDHMFFSAKQEQEKINSQPDEKNNVLFDLDLQIQDQKQENYVNQYNIANRKNLIYSLQQFVKQQQAQRKQQLFNEKIEIMEKKEKGEETKEDNFDEILKNIDDELDLGGAEFLDEAITDNKGKKEQNVKKNPNLVTIGMVGYPNVGKSSVINALCNKKLVGVGNMPGKTKAFQTVFIQDDVLLCDCPGLVFPNAGSTRGEMVLNGVLPIDRIIDYLGPIDLLVSRVPIVVFEQLYSLSIGLNKITADHLLTAYALKKGYVRGKGEPDEAKSAKLILKNVINGILIYCKLPPTYNEQKDGKIWQSNDLEKLKQQRQNAMKKGADQNTQYQYTLEEHQLMQNQNTLENKVFQNEIDENTEIFFDDNDLVRLMEGQRVQNIKLTKQQRREIKFSFQRGDKIDFKKYLKKEQIQDFFRPQVKNKNPQYL